MKRIMMIVYSYFPEDERLRREAEALVNAGYEVDVIGIKLPGQPKQEKVFSVNVHRLNMQLVRSSKMVYIYQYVSFLIRTFFKLNQLYIRNKYELIHVHNMPDFLVFLAVIQKLVGSKIILDLHDPSPEIYMTKFEEGEESFFIKMIKWQEKASIKFSHSVITTNKSFLDRFVSRGCPKDKINIVMNSPQESVFNKFIDLPPKDDFKGKFTIMYHGTIVERHGLDILARAVNLLRDKIPELKVIVYGKGEFVPKFIEEVKKLNIENILKYYGEVSLDEIAEAILQIDVGVIPNRIGPFTQLNFPVRIFEYLCNKKPTVVPRTQGIRDYFDEDSIFYFNDEDEEDLANVILKIYSDKNRTNDIVNKGFKIYEKYQWKKQGENLVNIYKKLLF